PSNDSYREQLSSCLQFLAMVQLESGRADEAVRSHGRVLAIREALARDDPASPERQSALAFCQLQLGKALDAAGRSQEALRRETQALTAFEELVRADPANALYRERLSACLTDLVSLQRRAGAPVARQSYERIVTIQEALARDNPTSFHPQVGLTFGYLQV